MLNGLDAQPYASTPRAPRGFRAPNRVFMAAVKAVERGSRNQRRVRLEVRKTGRGERS